MREKVMKKANLFYVFDDAFAECASVSICSFLENNNWQSATCIWIFDDGISDLNKKKISGMVGTHNCEIKYISTMELNDKLKRANVDTWRGRYSAYIKLFVGKLDLKRDVDKILFLDADTIVISSLEELFDINLDGYACAMALEGVPGSYYKYSGIEGKQLFNAGVILFNIEYWGKNNMEKRLWDYLNQKTQYFLLPEEDLLARVCENEISRLEPKYNMQTSFFIYSNRLFYNQMGWNKLENNFYSLNELIAQKGESCILHCIDCGTGRPWQEGNIHPYNKYYDFYRNKTKWREEKKRGMYLSLWHKILFIFRKVLPDKISIQFYLLTSLYTFNISVKKFYNAKKKVVMKGLGR